MGCLTYRIPEYSSFFSKGSLHLLRYPVTAAVIRDIITDKLYYIMHIETRDGSEFSHHACKGNGFVMFLFHMLYEVMLLVYTWTSQCAVYF
jgi:hypothetical protein